MSKTLIQASKRNDFGKASAKHLRREGLVPAVLYGKAIDNIHLAISHKDVHKFIADHGAGAKLNLVIDGQEEMAILKDVQKEVLKDEILHIEFQHLSAGTKIKMSLPIHFEGADNITKGLLLQKLANEVEIEALPKDLVDYIAVDVSNLELGNTLTVADLDMSQYPGIEIASDETMSLATVSEPTAFVEPSEEDEELAEGEEATVAEEADSEE